MNPSMPFRNGVVLYLSLAGHTHSIHLRYTANLHVLDMHCTLLTHHGKQVCGLHSILPTHSLGCLSVLASCLANACATRTISLHVRMVTRAFGMLGADR
jgi:hypothetical protein